MYILHLALKTCANAADISRITAARLPKSGAEGAISGTVNHRSAYSDSSELYNLTYLSIPTVEESDWHGMTSY